VGPASDITRGGRFNYLEKQLNEGGTLPERSWAGGTSSGTLRNIAKKVGSTVKRRESHRRKRVMYSIKVGGSLDEHQRGTNSCLVHKPILAPKTGRSGRAEGSEKNYYQKTKTGIIPSLNVIQRRSKERGRRGGDETLLGERCERRRLWKKANANLSSKEGPSS